QEMVRLTVGTAADARLGELGQPNRQVEVGARIVDRPVTAVAVAALRQHDAAEVEAAVEALGRGRPVVVAEAEPPPPLGERGRRAGGQRGDEGGGNQLAHGPSLPPILPAVRWNQPNDPWSNATRS